MTDQLPGLQDPLPELPNGLHYVEQFVAPEEETDLLENRIDRDHAADWLPDLSRRVQHHGFKYDYMARRIDMSMRLGDLPLWLDQLAGKVSNLLKEDKRFLLDEPVARFDQAIINEYQPGQGIAAHIDCEPCFGPVVATLSLGSDIEMQFQNPRTGEQSPVYLRRGSLAVLEGEARYKWTHAIAKRESDPPPGGQGKRVKRQRRVSITFRSVLLG